MFCQLIFKYHCTSSSYLQNAERCDAKNYPNR